MPGVILTDIIDRCTICVSIPNNTKFCFFFLVYNLKSIISIDIDSIVFIFINEKWTEVY